MVKSIKGIEIFRADGRLERFCEHGIGHTINVPLQHRNIKAWWVHGCCYEQCCKKWEEEAEKIFEKQKIKIEKHTLDRIKKRR